MKNLIILLFLFSAIAAKAQPDIKVDLVGYGEDTRGTISVTLDSNKGAWSFMLEKYIGDPNDSYDVEAYEVVHDMGDGNVFTDLEIGEYRLSGITGSGCSWGGMTAYNHFSEEVYRKCLVRIESAKKPLPENFVAEEELESLKPTHQSKTIPSSIDINQTLKISPTQAMETQLSLSN